jgi:predicted nuclease with RNAse H fold
VSSGIHAARMSRFCGVDVGTRALHCVAVSESYEVVDSAVFDESDMAEVNRWLEGAEAIAIDAPAELSRGAHASDPDPKLSTKFRGARCAEVALGRQFGYWVPWVTPTAVDPKTWMAVGLELHRSARAATAGGVLEVYPHACFRELAGGAALPKKSSAAGSARRGELLRQRGIAAPHLAMWSHDALDATVAAVVARQYHAGAAIEVGCEQGSACNSDGSRMWLPAAS